MAAERPRSRTPTADPMSLSPATFADDPPTVPIFSPDPPLLLNIVKYCNQVGTFPPRISFPLLMPEPSTGTLHSRILGHLRPAPPSPPGLTQAARPLSPPRTAPVWATPPRANFLRKPKVLAPVARVSTPLPVPPVSGVPLAVQLPGISLGHGRPRTSDVPCRGPSPTPRAGRVPPASRPQDPQDQSHALAPRALGSCAASVLRVR